MSGPRASTPSDKVAKHSLPFSFRRPPGKRNHNLQRPGDWLHLRPVPGDLLPLGEVHHRPRRCPLGRAARVPLRLRRANSRPRRGRVGGPRLGRVDDLQPSQRVLGERPIGHPFLTLRYVRSLCPLPPASTLFHTNTVLTSDQLAHPPANLQWRDLRALQDRHPRQRHSLAVHGQVQRLHLLLRSEREPAVPQP